MNLTVVIRQNKERSDTAIIVLIITFCFNLLDRQSIRISEKIKINN